MLTRSNPSPLVIGITSLALILTITFDKPLAYGDILDRDAWIPRRGGIPLSVNDVGLTGGKIFLRYTSFLGAADTLQFVGPPPIFRDIDNAILESFVSHVPFP